MKHHPKRFGRLLVPVFVAACCAIVMLLCMNGIPGGANSPALNPTVLSAEERSDGIPNKGKADDAANRNDSSDAATAQTSAPTDTITLSHEQTTMDDVSNTSQPSGNVEPDPISNDDSRIIESQPAQKPKVFQMPQDAAFVPDVVLVSVDKGNEGASFTELFGGRDFATVDEDSLRWISRDLVQLDVTKGSTVEDAVNELETSGKISGAQPDYIYTAEEERPSLYDAMAYAEQLPAIAEEGSDSLVVAEAKGATVNDPYYDMQWGLQSMNVPEAWENGAKSEQAIGVAVLDSGFIVDHEDLRGVIPDGAPYNSYYASKGNTDPNVLADVAPTFDEGNPSLASPEHGMHVAGIIAAQANNGAGTAGVSYNAQLIPIRVFNYGDTNGNYGATTSSLQKAFDYVIEKQDTYNIRVLNMSIGSKVNELRANDVVLKKMDEVYAKGIVMVCSGGNSTGTATPPFVNYPSDYITLVSALNLKNRKLVSNYEDIDGVSFLNKLTTTNYQTVQLAESSNYNLVGDMAKNISAPGSQILSTTTSKNDIRKASVPYGLMGGTSMAAPHVAGVLALMFSQKTDVPKTAAGAQYMVDTLYSSARQLTDNDFDQRFGYGEANALSATSAVNGPHMEGPAYVHVGQANISFSVSSGSGWQFSTTDQDVLSVDSNGTSCSALRSGQVAVVATQGSQKLRKTVTVVGEMTGPQVMAVQSSESFSIDQPVTLMWNWKSSNEDSATPTDTGTVNAGEKAGTATITATLQSSGGVASDLTLSRDVFIVGPLSGQNKIRVGQSEQLEIALPQESGITLEDFDWSVDNDSIATISKQGEVTGKNAGKAVVSATLKQDRYAGSKIAFEITIQIESAVSLKEVAIQPIANQPYTGTQVTPEPVVTWNGTTLRKDVDYQLTYRNNTNPGTATVVIAGTGGFTGVTTVSFTIQIVFEDVNESTAHADDITWLAGAGISEGWKNTDGTREFRPSAKVARADMAAFLYRLADRWGLIDKNWKPESTSAFSDVTTSTAHCREIWWLAQTGISEGWTLSDGTKQFRPYDSVARQDMAAFLFRLAKLANVGGASDSWTANKEAQSKFRDVDANDAHNHHTEVWWLAQTGVSQGWDVGGGMYEFRGMQAVARQDMAAFLHRLDGLR